MGRLEHAHEQVRTYVIVFVTLLGLTLVTVAAATLHLILPLAIAVALVIAAAKGTLVAGFFMHLVRERPAIFAALALTALLLAALVLLPFFAARDQVGTRIAQPSAFVGEEGR